MSFVFILLLFPSYPDPSPNEMNYAVVVLGFVLVFCVVYYYIPGFGGKTFFKGPVRTIDDLVNDNPEIVAQLESNIAHERPASGSGSGSNDEKIKMERES